MRVRSLIHAVEIQTLTGSTVATSRGQNQAAFATVETVQAAIMPLSGRELTQARMIDENTTHRVEMHYTDTINPRSRLKFGTRYFNILQALNVDERNRWLQLQCVEEL